MSLLSSMLAAANRLLSFYNGNEYNADNLGGMTGPGGMANNWDACIQDIGAVATGIGETAGTVLASQSVIAMTWDAATAVADPGAGKLRATTGNPAVGSYSLLASATDSAGANIASMLTALGASGSAVKARARLVKVGDASTYLDLQVTGVSGAGAYRTVAVTCIGGPGGFAAGDAVALGWVRTGDKGDTGAAGAQGAGPVYYSTPTAGSANAQTLAGPLASLSGNPSVEFVAGKSNVPVTRANLVTAPTDFSAWTAFGGAAVTANTTIAPDGSTTADTITAPSGGGVNTSMAVPADAVTRVYSIHLLPGTSTAGRLQLNHGGNNAGISYDLAAGTVSAWFGSVVASAINPVPTGGYRVEIATANGGGTAIVPHIFPVGGSGSGSVIAWGAQVETGAVATPYHAGTVTDGHMTLAVGSTPARPLVDAAGKALAPGAIAYGTKYVATYDGSSWRLAGGGGASVNLAATHAALFSI